MSSKRSRARGRGKSRKPVAVEQVAHPAKRPRVETETSIFSLKPVWSVAFLDVWWGARPQEGCGWIHLQPEDHKKLLERLRNFETMTWNEILLSRQSPHHMIAVADCSSSAQKRLLDLQLEEIDELVSLRVSATARVFGVLGDGVCKILWWDPYHAVCPSVLKHT